MSFEEDPEVVADLKLRAYTERDKSRTRTAEYDWKPPPVVTQWKCRTPPCKEFVDVDAETIERWEIFNRELRKRGEKPIASHEVLWCASCLGEHARIRPDRLRARVERMRSVIQQLKAGDQTIRYRTNDGEVATDERAALEQLKAWGHPDVPALVESIRQRNATPSKRERRGGM